jgi:hypothetical protein
MDKYRFQFGLYGDETPSGYNYASQGILVQLFGAALKGDWFGVLMKVFYTLEGAAYLTWLLLSELIDPSNISGKPYTWLAQNTFIYINFFYYKIHGKTLKLAPPANLNNLIPFINCTATFDHQQNEFNLSPNDLIQRATKLFIYASDGIRRGNAVCSHWTLIKITDYEPGITYNVYNEWSAAYPDLPNYRCNIWFRLQLVCPITGFHTPSVKGFVEYQ